MEITIGLCYLSLAGNFFSICNLHGQLFVKFPLITQSGAFWQILSHFYIHQADLQSCHLNPNPNDNQKDPKTFLHLNK